MDNSLVDFESLLEGKFIEFRLGARDVYTETKGSANQFRQNYITYINCPEQAIVPGSLWVRDNRLFTGPDEKNTTKNVTTFLQSSAVMADKLHLPASVGNRLTTLSETWEKIPFLENPEKESNEIINQQLAAMKNLRLKGRPDASRLLDAIIFTTFSPN